MNGYSVSHSRRTCARSAPHLLTRGACRFLTAWDLTRKRARASIPLGRLHAGPRLRAWSAARATRRDGRVRCRIRPSADASRRGRGRAHHAGRARRLWLVPLLYPDADVHRRLRARFSSMGAPGVDEVRWLLPVRPTTSFLRRPCSTPAPPRAGSTWASCASSSNCSTPRASASDPDHVADDGAAGAGRIMSSGRISRWASAPRSGATLHRRRHQGLRGADPRRSISMRRRRRARTLGRSAPRAGTPPRSDALMVEYQRRGDDARRARGRPVATLGPSPGFREERLKPVYVGDTVTYATEVIERASIAGPAGSNVDPQQRGQSKDEP